MKKICSILLMLLILAGCTPKHETDVSLYFISSGGQEMKAEMRTVPQNGSLLEETIQALLSGPHTGGLVRVIPAKTTLLGVKTAGTVAEINVSAPFDTGSLHTRLMARYTLIATACGVGDVQKVKIFVEGKPLESLYTGEPLGALGTSDFGAGLSESGAETLLALYFPDQSGRFLMPEARKVTLWDGQTAENAVVNEILRGPSASHLFPALSDDTKMISAETKDGVCFVNMEDSFLKKNTGDAQREKIAVYAIVNSLCALPDVKEVRFLIDGRVVKNFGRLIIDAGLTENTALYPAV